MFLKPGDRFGRYELLEILGTGGMGDVFRANDTVLHRLVALKVLRAAPSDSPGARSSPDGAALILREARFAAGIVHPNAISIHDVGELDGVPFLAMEFVPGRTLRTFVGDPTVSLSRRIRWLVDAARALGAAHQLGLVHRDIKPENIMVRDDGVVKVLDFGIAIARRQPPVVDRSAPTRTLEPHVPNVELAAAASEHTLTRTGYVLGTPLYMPPEQMRGEAVDGRADQFAWGVVAYELLTGSLPWDRNATALQLVAQILSREVEPLFARDNAIPASVDSVVRTTLSRAPASRFALMDDVADELEPYAAIGVTTAKRRPQRRSKAPGMLASVPPPILDGPSTAPLLPSQSTRSPPSTRPAQRAGHSPWLFAFSMVAAVTAAVFFGEFILARRATPTTHVTVAPSAEIMSQMSSNANATAAYRLGVQAFRDGSLDTALAKFDEALRGDPSFAAAHLQRALLTYELIRPEVREHLRAARNARATLGERDLVLLDAMEPWALVPPDLQESAHRFEAAVAKYPDDANFSFELGWTLHHAYRRPEALAAFNDTLIKDPHFGMALCMKAREFICIDDVPKALIAYRECLKLSPGATSCLDDLSSIQAKEGECTQMTGTCRQFIGVAPDSPQGYACLAEALLARGEGISAARAALQQKWDRTPESTRRRTMLRDESSLAALTGKFDESIRYNSDIEDMVEGAPDRLTHFVPALWRMLVDLEIGHDADVGLVAENYLARRSAWLADDFLFDLSIMAYDAELLARQITPTHFGELRDEWQNGESQRLKRTGWPEDGTSWALAYALPTSTAFEAKAAIAKRPSHRPLLDLESETSYCDQPIGHVYALAGNLEDAIHYSERARNSCLVIYALSPMFATWAAFDAGRAHEERGETTAACSAYGQVLERWGNANPPSQTAAKARQRAASLRCHSN